jgi:ubiquitin C-terminal hydrolase
MEPNSKGSAQASQILIDKTSDNKGKLKSLFDEMDKQNKYKNEPNKKNSKIPSEKITENQKYKDYNFKTKPTKPDFSAQFEHFNISQNFSQMQVSQNSNYKGLNNFGNVCYSNVVMQCLISIKEFVDMLNSIHEELESTDSYDIPKEFPYLYNLVKIMNYYQIKNTSLASNHIKYIVNLFDYTGEQNDAHEFLVFIFDKLNDEILKISSLKNINTKTEDFSEWEEVKKGGKRMKAVNKISSFQTSTIGKIFQGVLKHEIQSKGESLSKCNLEPFFILSLDFGENSIISCFNKFFAKRKIETDKTSLSQKSYLESLPEILIVHLKAFYFDKNTKQIVKINKNIDYSDDLNLTEYLSPSMQNQFKTKKYELISGKKT